MILRWAVLAAIFVCLRLAAALALEPALTEREAKSVVDAARELKPLVDQYGEALERWSRPYRNDPALREDPCRWPPESGSAPGYAEMTAVTRRHGFAEPEQFCLSGLRVFAVCGALEAERSDPNWRLLLSDQGSGSHERQAQMEEARRQIEANPNLAPEQKQQLLAQIGEALGNLAEVRTNPLMRMMADASAEDIAVATPYCPALSELFIPFGAPRPAPTPAPR